jgi:hypothetical protein
MRIERRGVASSHAALAAAAIATVCPLAILTSMLPTGLVLPALSLVLMALAGAAAVFAFATGSDRDSAGFSAWDVAGVLFLAGCCAAMLSEPAQFLAALEDAQFAHQADPFPRDPPR